MAVEVPPITPAVRIFARFLAFTLAAVGPSLRGRIGVSSWYRSPERNAEVQRQRGRSVTASLHTTGLGIDLVGELADLAAFRARWKSYGLDAIDEGDHLHVELDGPYADQLRLRGVLPRKFR